MFIFTVYRITVLTKQYLCEQENVIKYFFPVLFPTCFGLFSDVITGIVYWE